MTAIVILLLALAALPFLALIWIAASASFAQWEHLFSYVVPQSLWDTGLLLILVGTGCAILGAGTAWLTTLCNFPGRRFFSWALVLPLAVPVYIAAYTHLEFFDFSGPVQSALRQLTGSRLGWFPELRSVGGAAFVFTLVLYPYVYMASRLLFAMQGASAVETARALGAGPMRVFGRIGLPMARPAIAAGVVLALMETLNDIGGVEILGVRTLGFAVFETWLNRENLGGAVQLSLMLLIVVILLMWIERRARRDRRYAVSHRDKPAARMDLSAGKQALAVTACASPIILGLGIPVFVLGSYFMRRLGSLFEPTLVSAAVNSIVVSLSTAALATAIAYGLLQFARLYRRSPLNRLGRLVSLGYAVPGTVLAIGLLIALAGFDNWLDAQFRDRFGFSTGLLTSGTILIVIYACTLRFLAIAYGTLESGFARLSDNVDMAGRALGRTGAQLALQIHLPIMKTAMSVAFLLVFVDTMKELSATLLLRPFGFETLATLIYSRASQSATEDAAAAALLIVVIGLLPVVLLSALPQQAKKRTRTSMFASENS